MGTVLTPIEAPSDEALRAMRAAEEESEIPVADGLRTQAVRYADVGCLAVEGDQFDRTVTLRTPPMISWSTVPACG